MQTYCNSNPSSRASCLQDVEQLLEHIKTIHTCIKPDTSDSTVQAIAECLDYLYSALEQAADNITSVTKKQWLNIFCLLQCVVQYIDQQSKDRSDFLNFNFTHLLYLVNNYIKNIISKECYLDANHCELNKMVEEIYQHIKQPNQQQSPFGSSLQELFNSYFLKLNPEIDVVNNHIHQLKPKRHWCETIKQQAQTPEQKQIVLKVESFIEKKEMTLIEKKEMTLECQRQNALKNGYIFAFHPNPAFENM